MNRQRFERGRNRLARCRCCGNLTHSTMDGQLDIRMCRVCLESSGQENAHSDGGGHDPFNPACPTCRGVGCLHELADKGQVRPA